MATMKFPKTMKQGKLKGRHFDTYTEYAEALRELKVTKPSKPRNPDWRFVLHLTAGSLEIEITGDPRKTEDVDKLLDLLGQYGGAK
jgi:hypothetical protein